MAGRAEFFRQQRVHSQRELTYVKPAPTDNDSWITSGLAACRAAACDGDDNRILAYYFATEMDTSLEEAERRLRHLSKIGVLNMSVERDLMGKFVRYYWVMVNPNLPSKEELR